MRLLAHALFAASLFISAGSTLATMAATDAAATVGDVAFAAQTQADSQALVLQGAGLRTRLSFRIYAMGLYLQQPYADAGAIIADEGEKRIRIVLLRDLEAKQFADALQTGLQKNHDAEALAALQPATDALLSALREVGAAPAGTEILLDRLASGATRLQVAGSVRGGDIADPALYPALLRIWLGTQPADGALKKALAEGRK